MSGWRVWASGEPESKGPWEAFGEAVASTRRGRTGEVRVLEYPLEATLGGLERARRVHLELEDGHENRHTRRYTFLIRGDQDEDERARP